MSAAVIEPELFRHRVARLVDAIGYKDGYRLRCEEDQATPGGRIFLQVQGFVVNTDTGQREWMGGGKAYLSEHQTDSEIVRVALGLFLSFEEHECREAFTYLGRPIFGPHSDVNALWQVADRLDIREG